MSSEHPLYRLGPTTCVAHPRVIKSIRKQIKSARALTTADARLAVAMGLISADAAPVSGMNDGVFYPFDAEGPVGQAGEDTRVRSLAAKVAMAPAKAAKGSPAERTKKPVTTGTLHSLALMVDFPDNPGTRPKTDFAKLLFDPTNPGSMTSYYRELSMGKLTVTGEAVGWIRMPKPYSYYCNNQSGMADTYPQNGPGMLFDALTEFCRTDSLSRFDTDGDGYVDGIFLIHAGGGAEAEPSPAKRKGMIWSHKWTLPKPFTNGGTSVFAYSTEPEDGRVGVFAHEFGHVLGLPDLYDTSYRSAGVGAWCIMGAGSWGGGGNQPSRMSCWCLSDLGWITPKVVKAASSLTIPPLATDPKACYRLWSKGTKGPEYFLIEHREKTGQDVSLPNGGLLVWHIDERQSANTNPTAYRVGLEQADGRKDLELNANDGDAGDTYPGSKKNKSFTDTSVPSSRSHLGVPTGVSLTAITLKNGAVTAKAKV